MRPKVSIALSNGNLNIKAPSAFGTSGVVIAAPVAPVAGYGIAFLVKTKAQAKTALGQTGNEEVLEAITNGFFAEAEGTPLYVVCVANTNKLDALAADTIAGKVIAAASGQLRLLSFVKFPANNYTPTVTNGFDADVHNAVIAAQALATTYFTAKKPFRFFVEGYGFTDATDAKDYSSSGYRNGAIVIGAIDDNTATATLLAMGRAAASAPQQNIGRIKTGSLSIAETSVVKIGSDLVDAVSDADLDTIYNKRYITFERNQVASGYVFNDDNMLTAVTDDYNNLAYGRIIDNAVRIAYTTYYRELKDDVDVTEDGRLGTVAEKALENAIENDININMPGQLNTKRDGSADVIIMVNPDPVANPQLYEQNGITAPNLNLLSGGTVYLFIMLRPKGYLKYLNVFLGFTN